MPRKNEYRVEWSKLNGYEFIHDPFRYSLAGRQSLDYWLDVIETFHFCSSTGYTLTLRKEKKQRGTGYWYAYKRIGNKVHKKYLGTKEHVTIDVLETVARQFVEPASQQGPAPPPRQPTLKFTRSLDSALSIYGFRSIPSQRELIVRYRELSKQHHPDTGGLHEDMVAVNLAYEYLKSFVR